MCFPQICNAVTYQQRKTSKRSDLNQIVVLNMHEIVSARQYEQTINQIIYKYNSACRNLIKNGIFHQCFYDHAIIKSDTSKLITSFEILFVKTDATNIVNVQSTFFFYYQTICTTNQHLNQQIYISFHIPCYCLYSIPADLMTHSFWYPSLTINFFKQCIC